MHTGASLTIGATVEFPDSQWGWRLSGSSASAAVISKATQARPLTPYAFLIEESNYDRGAARETLRQKVEWWERLVPKRWESFITYVELLDSLDSMAKE